MGISKKLAVVALIIGVGVIGNGCKDEPSSLLTEKSELAGGGIRVPHNERLHLSTDQQWIAKDGHLSDLIRLQWTKERAKPAISYADEKGEDKAALVAHAKANDPKQKDHNHFSIETTMSPTGKNAGQLFTRLSIPFDTDVSEIQTHSSNFTVMNGKLQVAGEDKSNRDILLSNSVTEGANQSRWGLRADGSEESGGNKGSNFRIVRYSDKGEAIDSPIFIQRDNGNVGISTSEPTSKLDVNDKKFRVRSSFTPASASSPGNQGDIAWDEKYIYICVAPNTWKRTELSSW